MHKMWSFMKKRETINLTPTVCKTDNSVKYCWSLPISNHIPDLHKVNACTMIDINLVKLSSRNQNTDRCTADLWPTGNTPHSYHLIFIISDCAKYLHNYVPFLTKDTNYSQTSMTQTSLGPGIFAGDMGSLSHRGLIMTSSGSKWW